jgi:hypothetical protein
VSRARSTSMCRFASITMRVAERHDK